jgi:hypothetical protein
MSGASGPKRCQSAARNGPPWITAIAASRRVKPSVASFRRLVFFIERWLLVNIIREWLVMDRFEQLAGAVRLLQNRFDAELPKLRLAGFIRLAGGGNDSDVLDSYLSRRGSA